MDHTSCKNPAELQLDLDFRSLVLTKQFPITLIKSSHYVFCKLMVNIVVDIIEVKVLRKSFKQPNLQTSLVTNKWKQVDI